MTAKLASKNLQVFFAQLVDHDPAATLGDARDKLDNPEGGSSQQVGGDRVGETQRLVEAHGEDCSLQDFLADMSAQTEAGPGAHG